MVDWKEFLRPTKAKIIALVFFLALIGGLFLILPSRTPPTYRGSPPYENPATEDTPVTLYRESFNFKINENNAIKVNVYNPALTMAKNVKVKITSCNGSIKIIEGSESEEQDIQSRQEKLFVLKIPKSKLTQTAGKGVCKVEAFGLNESFLPKNQEWLKDFSRQAYFEITETGE